MFFRDVPFFRLESRLQSSIWTFFFACYPQKGQTPLHYAAQNDHSQVVTLFLTHKPGVMMQQNAVRRQKIITKGCSHSLWRRANAQSVCSETLYGGQVTQLIKKKLSCYTPQPTQHHSFLKTLHPLFVNLNMAEWSALTDNEKSISDFLSLSYPIGGQHVCSYCSNEGQCVCDEGAIEI